MLQMPIQPRPQLRKRFVGYPAIQKRLRFYLGVRGDSHKPVEIWLANDRSFLVSILVHGPSGSGKSITTRILIENFFLEWRIFGERWRHPIIIFDSKNNCSGLDHSNSYARDRFLLRTIHPKWNHSLHIPRELIHVYLPAYVAPTEKREVLRVMHKKWGAEGFWGVPWRHITDLAHLGTVLKVPSEALWAEELRPTFEKATLDPNMTLKELIGVGGVLEKASKSIRNTASRSASLNFVNRWRHNRYWFANSDTLAQHLEDPFSVNVLTFVETPEKIYFNQLALLIALESLMATLQESKTENQPVIIIHDILNFVGKEKPFRNQIIDALRRLIVAGQARTHAHGYVVIVETQSLDLPEEMGNWKNWTINMRLKWKSQCPYLEKVDGFIGGLCDYHDNFNNFHCPSVVVRPPLTSYTV